jgi:peptidoglycan DL-endopeptidase CwlO
MRKLILVFLLVIATAITSTNSVYADKKTDAQKQANQAAAELKAMNDKMNAIEKQQKALQGEMKGMNQQLVAILMAKTALEADIASTQEAIVVAQADLEVAKAKEQKQYEDMKLRIQYMYENGDTNFVTEMLESKSMADLINKTEYYNQVYTSDRKMLVTYQQTKLEAIDLEAGLQRQMAGMEEMKTIQVAQQKQYESIIANLDAKLGSANNQLSSAQAMASKYQNTVNEQNAIIKSEVAKEAARKKAEEEARKKAEAENNSGGFNGNETSTEKGKAIVAYAKTFLGIPYVWGGKTPAGFDCSGLTSYVFRHFGYNVPTYSMDQAYVGKAVKYNEMQAGDLIVYEPKNGIGHVAIYIGGGQIIQAPQTGDVVKITGDPDYRAIRTIRRLI